MEENQDKNKWWRPYNTREYSVEELIEEFDGFRNHCNDAKIKNQYWQNIPKPLWVAWFCSWLGKGKNYINQLAQDESYKGAILYMKTCMEEQIWDLAMAWVYNPTIASKNLSANFDWKDKTEVDQNVKWTLETNLNEEQMKLIANRVLNGKTSITNDAESE